MCGRLPTMSTYIINLYLLSTSVFSMKFVYTHPGVTQSVRSVVPHAGVLLKGGSTSF